MNKKNEKIAAAKPASVPQARRKGLFGVFASFLIMVIMPVAMATFYYNFYAVRIYETESSVAVRKEAVVSEDSIGVSLGSASALAIYADSFLVVDFARSRDVVIKVMSEIDLDSFFIKGVHDPLYYYPREASMEKRVKFWQDMIDADFDVATGIIKLKVRAFAPEDTLAIANILFKLLELRVMEMSEKAQSEAVRYAEAHLEKAINSLGKHRVAIQEFRNKNEIVDPSSEVANLNTLITTLSQELIRLKTERAVMRATSQNNPKLIQLDVKIKNTLRIIEEIKKGQSDFEHVGRLPELLHRYELLKNNSEIANQLYIKALEQLDEANASAVLRQAHLYASVVFSKPYDPMRPDLPFDLLKVLLICISSWGIYRLVV